MGIAYLRAEGMKELVLAPVFQLPGSAPEFHPSFPSEITHVREHGIMGYQWPHFSVDYATLSGVQKLPPAR